MKLGAFPFLVALTVVAQLGAACSSPTGLSGVVTALYVANNGWITVYAPGDTGNAAPVSTIGNLFSPLAIARDRSGRLYVAAQNDSIAVFAPGGTSPISTIGGTNTGLSSPVAIAIDAAGHVFVANQGDTITIYAPGASGNAPPVARITGGNTRLRSPTGLAFDGEGRLYVSNAGDSSIAVYSRGATGNVSPETVI